MSLCLTARYIVQGSLGFGSLDDQYEPACVDLPLTVYDIACGHYHSLVSSAEGQVWSWGCAPELAAQQT